MAGPGSSGQQGFDSPTGEAATPSEENASIQFEPPTEGLAEQAAFTVSPEAVSGIPAQLVEARDQLAQAIQQQGRPRGAWSVEALTSDVGNIQGVGIGLGRPGDPQAIPGTPTLNVFVAEDTRPEQVRSAVVDAMGVQAVGDLPMTVRRCGFLDAQAHRFKVRPAPGGNSIGHPKVTAGTLGCLAVGRSSPRNSRLLLLSNNHVAANSNNAVYGDCIAQPGYYDGGQCPADQIAILERFVPITFGGTTNHVDCATGWCWPDRVRRDLVQLSGGVPQYFRISNQPQSAQLGWNVGKSGRTTQLTQGRVVTLNWSGWINYGVGSAWFAGQFVVQGLNGDFSAGGDSGSAVWTWDAAKYPVGLLFAGGGGYTICNPMLQVLSALDINLYT